MSNLMVLLHSAYMISNYCLIVTCDNVWSIMTNRDISRSLKVKSDGPVRSLYISSYSHLKETYGLTPPRLWDISLQNLGDFNVGLSRSLKVKYDGSVRLPIYHLLLTFNSNMWPNSGHLQDINLQNLSDLEFDLSRSTATFY